MEIGAILFSLAMILLVAAYVLQPFAKSERGVHRDINRRLSALQAERDRVLDSIQEMDTDHSMGKVDQEDYRRQRLALTLEGAEILRKIDELQTAPGTELDRKTQETKEMELEAAVAHRRGISSLASSPLTKSNSNSGEGSCRECGEGISHGDRYCANCGVTLEEQVA